MLTFGTFLWRMIGVAVSKNVDWENKSEKIVIIVIKVVTLQRTINCFEQAARPIGFAVEARHLAVAQRARGKDRDLDSAQAGLNDRRK